MWWQKIFFWKLLKNTCNVKTCLIMMFNDNFKCYYIMFNHFRYIITCNYTVSVQEFNVTRLIQKFKLIHENCGCRPPLTLWIANNLCLYDLTNSLNDSIDTLSQASNTACFRSSKLLLGPTPFPPTHILYHPRPNNFY